MVFRRALLGELSNTAGAVFTVLFSIVFSISLVRILGEAAGGQVDDHAVFSIVALSALTSLPTLLTLTLFISVLSTLTRSYRDSEMVIWFASGLSLLAWVRPVMRFAAPILVLIAGLSLVVSPWAERQITESKTRYARRDDVSKIAPGRFVESTTSNRVIFVETVDLDGRKVHNVFVRQPGKERDEITVADNGIIETHDDGTRYLVLLNGRRYQGTPGQPEYRLMEFDRYGLRLDAPPPEPIENRSTRSVSTLDLVRDSNRFNRAELLGRFGAAVSAGLLALLAIPLAYVRPRVGRSANMIAALLIFLLYQNMVEISQAWVVRDRISVAGAAAIVHGAAALVLLVLFFRRLQPLRRRRFGVANQGPPS